MVNSVILGASLRNVLTSVQGVDRTIDIVTERLATGLKVNSALDNPQNFFTAAALRNVALDHERLLNGIGQSKRVIEEALIGTEAVNELIDQAEAIAEESKTILEAGGTDPNVVEVEVNSSPPSISQQIFDSAPDVYFRLNETAGPIVNSGMAVLETNPPATYTNGASPNAAPLYTNGSAPSVEFDGVNDRISVNDSAFINLGTYSERTVELVFNADTTVGRQVLFEEGATVNGLTIYIDNGDIRVTAEDDGQYADVDISAPIIAGQTYHVAFRYDSTAQEFTGWLNGVQFGTFNTGTGANFPSHSGDIGIGGVSGGVQFHDGEDGAGSGFNFDGRISDVAIHNRALTDAELISHGTSLNATTSIEYRNQEYEKVLDQIDFLIEDAQYAGNALLENDTIETQFNPDGTSTLETEGADLSTQALGFERINFNNLDDVNAILESIRAARQQVEIFAQSLLQDINVLDTREEFTRNKINTHEAGAEDLTVADLNKEGANLLALQTRQTLGTTSLSLAAQSLSSVLRLF